MIKRSILLSFLALSNVAIANNAYRAMAHEALAKKATLIAPYHQDAEQAMQNAERVIQKLMQETTKTSEHKKPLSQVLIFVSFSMPKESLLAYLRDGKKAHATLVIRGLKDNSFKKTMLHIQDVVQQSGGDGMVLDPMLFRRFQVKQVPTIVVLADNNDCMRQNTCERIRDADVIAGNITLEAALKMIRDHGTVGTLTASRALKRLQGETRA